MNRKRLREMIICLSAGAALLTGCGGSIGDLAVIPNSSYEKEDHEEAIVQKGELTADFTMRLKAEGYEYVAYSEDDPGLEIDQLYVSVGDKVQKGDVLLTFKSEDLENKLESRQEDRDQKQLLADHYRKLMKADDSLDYDSDIESLEMDINVDDLYIKQYQEQLKDYTIYAEGSGTIVKVSDSVLGGIYVPKEAAIQEACGTGNYTGTTKENRTFVVGEEFTAKCGVAEYIVKVSAVSTEETDGETESTVTFTPVSDMSGVAENEALKVTITQDALDDVVYVESKAVHTIKEQSYVYTLDENGYEEIVWVKTGAEVGDYTVITEGLEGGEKVAL